MISISNRAFVWVCSAMLFLATAFYAYSQQIYFLAIPPGLLVIAILIQYPRYLFYLLILSIPWSFEFNFNPHLGTDLPDEPLMLLASVTVVIYLLHRRRVIPIKSIHLLSLIIILQLLWTCITVITSADFILSIKYLMAKSWYLLAFFALPLILFEDINFFKKAVLLFLGSMLVVTTVILIKQGINDWTFGKVNNAVRPFFRNHVSYSSLLVFMVPLLLATIRLSVSKKVRWMLCSVLAVTFLAVYLSYARGAWVALLAGVIAYWLLHKRLLVFGFLFFLITVIIGVFWIKSNDRFMKFSNDYKSTIYHSNFEDHLIATYQLKDLSNAERIYRWIAGVRMVGDSWQTGFGPSTFYCQYKSYTLPAFKTYVSDNPEKSTVHNYFLLLLVEQGIMGCFLFVALITTMFHYVQEIYFRTNEKLWKVVSAAVGSILVMQCVINFLSDMIETDKVGSVFYLCLATLVIADIKTRKAKSNLSPDIKRIP